MSSSARTGAATAVGREVIPTLPTSADRINDSSAFPPSLGRTFERRVRRTGQPAERHHGGRLLFQQLLRSRRPPGDRTGVAPISTAAVEEMQVNVAPFDVRQGHFVGAAVNTVTRSGGIRSGVRPTGQPATTAWWAPRPGQVLQPRHLRLPQLRRLVLRADHQGQALLLRELRKRQSVGTGTTFLANTGVRPWRATPPASWHRTSRPSAPT